MSKTKIAIIIFLVAWLAVKLIALQMGNSETGFHIGVFVNMSGLILLPYLALREKYTKISSDEGFLADVKTAAKPGALYALLVSAGIFAYFNFIDPDFTAAKYREAIEILDESAGTDEAFAKLQEENPALKDYDRADYYEKNKGGIEMIFSNNVQAGASFVVLVFVALIYGLLITIFHRKVLLKI